MRFKYRRQRPIKGGREALPSCVIKEIRDAVEFSADKFKVSKSFVVAVALAAYFGIDEQETYLPRPKSKGGTR